MKKTATAMWLLAACAAIPVAGHLAGESTLRAEPQAPGRATEPAEDTSWDRKAAATFLDDRLGWWMDWPTAARDHDTFCVSCHTAFPYALARPALRAALNERAPSPRETRLMESVLKRVRMWKDVEPFYPDQTFGIPKTTESRGTESVLNSLILASRDARTGTLSDDGRTAFGHLWALQMRTGEVSGAWAWLNFRLEPWESADARSHGAALAAFAVGIAPQDYAARPDIQNNLRLLRGYVGRQFERERPLNRLMLLLASTKLTSLLTPDQRDQTVRDVLASQQRDGGWATASLGTWQRTDGSPLDTGSDGYATGLATFVLQQVGLASTRAQIDQGLQWLRQHQDKTTGQWWASSLNKQRDRAAAPAQFMSDAATAFAVLALTAE